MRKRRWRMAGRIGAARPADPEPDLLGAAMHRRGGDEPVDRADVATNRGAPRRARVAEALDAAPDVRPCAICARAARGFFYTNGLRPDRYPTYAFCSKACLDAGAAIAKGNRGMIDKTELEAQAIKAAR